MTIEQLCLYLQLSRSTLYKLAQEGKVPGQKVGKHWRFSKDAIDRWLESPSRDRAHRDSPRGGLRNESNRSEAA